MCVFVLLFVAVDIVVVVGSIQEADEGTSPLSHSCTPLQLKKL